MNSQITTVTFFKYRGLRHQFWALKMMQFAHTYLRKTAGLSFYKVMGSGKGLGFNPYPDWSTYSLVQVWESEQHATQFFQSSTLFKKYKAHASESWSVYAKNISARGAWSGGNPFIKSDFLDSHNKLLMVITRARVKTSKLISFWSQVPSAQTSFTKSKGLIYTKGIGERPIIQMATFSIWEEVNALEKFAKDTSGHGNAASKAIHFNWFKEDLFSRFQPYKFIGTWGNLPLDNYKNKGIDYSSHH